MLTRKKVLEGETNRFNCGKCKIRFNNRNDNQEHIRMKHEYECEQCGNKDIQEAEMEQHIKQIHEEEKGKEERDKLYQYEQCNKRLKNEKILMIHMETSHMIVQMEIDNKDEDGDDKEESELTDEDASAKLNWEIMKLMEGFD